MPDGRVLAAAQAAYTQANAKLEDAVDSLRQLGRQQTSLRDIASTAHDHLLFGTYSDCSSGIFMALRTYHVAEYKQKTKSAN